MGRPKDKIQKALFVAKTRRGEDRGVAAKEASAQETAG